MLLHIFIYISVGAVDTCKDIRLAVNFCIGNSSALTLAFDRKNFCHSILCHIINTVFVNNIHFSDVESPILISHLMGSRVDLIFHPWNFCSLRCVSFLCLYGQRRRCSRCKYNCRRKQTCPQASYCFHSLSHTFPSFSSYYSCPLFLFSYDITLYISVICTF